MSQLANHLQQKNTNFTIRIPSRWYESLHRKRIMYFLPDWDDHVDLRYDFLSDSGSQEKPSWEAEYYAHQIYESPNYDGLLVSKAAVDESKRKKGQIFDQGIHNYLRVPGQFPVLGDSGAFSYVDQELPPYSIEEILTYYTHLGVNMGVSLDHLIFDDMSLEEKKRRYELNLYYAENFLKEHKAHNLPWTPIGVIQGWDLNSYQKSTAELIKMGYPYIALGGIIKTSTKNLLTILEAIKPDIPTGTGLHLFGIGRENAMDMFARYKVTSVDSASCMRKAWMDAKDNYFTESGEKFAAFRIPEAGNSYRAKDVLQYNLCTFNDLFRIEKAALNALRAYDKGLMNLKECLEAVITYDQMIARAKFMRKGMSGQLLEEELAKHVSSIKKLYRKSLQAKAWQKCSCRICKEIGNEVVIFRGKNRNRRRGFHNTSVFYERFKRNLLGIEQNKTISQLALF